MNGYHSYSPSRNESRNPSLKRLVEKRCPKKSQNHNSLHRQAPFEPISEENSPNGTRKAENLSHYRTSIPHSSRTNGHYTIHPMSTSWAIADDCYCNWCQNALSDSESSKVESPSPNTNHRVSGGSVSLFSCFRWTKARASQSQWLGTKPSNAEHPPLLPKQKNRCQAHPLGKVTALTNLKINLCKKSPKCLLKPILNDSTRQDSKPSIDQSNGYASSFWSVAFALVLVCVLFFCLESVAMAIQHQLSKIVGWLWLWLQQKHWLSWI